MTAFGDPMPSSLPLARPAAEKLKQWFQRRSDTEAFDKPYTLFAFRVRGETLAWSYYPKKQVLVEEGKAGAHGEALRAGLMAEFFPGTAATATGAAATAGAAGAPRAFPYIGSDESGKGDTFGPLVVAACRLDADAEEALRIAGVRDSKALTEPGIRRLADQIRSTLAADAYTLRILEPRAYNDLQAEVQNRAGNLNHLLGELHGACIYEVWQRCGAQWAIVDEFGAERFLRAHIPPGLPFALEKRAECYTAVAAASILAREACLDWFAAEAHYGREWPRGSSDPRILPLLREVCMAEGKQAVRKYAKVHFASVQRILDES
jgi:ribonuclease HIII